MTVREHQRTSTATASRRSGDSVHGFLVLVRPLKALSDDQFYEFCRLNDELQIERTAQGDLLLMAPASFRTSHLNLRIAVQLGQWVERDGTGLATESSGGFILPDSAVVAPDAAWIPSDRLNAVPRERQDRFLPLRGLRDRVAVAYRYARQDAGQDARVSRQRATARLVDRSVRTPGPRLPPGGRGSGTGRSRRCRRRPGPARLSPRSQQDLVTPQPFWRRGARTRCGLRGLVGAGAAAAVAARAGVPRRLPHGCTFVCAAPRTASVSCH